MTRVPLPDALSALPVSVGRTVARLGRQVEVALAEVDLSIAQYRALTSLSDGAAAASALAARLAVSRPTATAVVEGLVQRGLIAREHSVTDRRRVSITLTPAGRVVVETADDAVRKRLEEILSSASPRQSAQAIHGVGQWGEALDAHRIRKRESAGDQRAPAGDVTGAAL
jgi:long-chain acyl-CoA synthetase